MIGWRKAKSISRYTSAAQGNLDTHTADEIMQLILGINAAGTTVLMATHNQYLVDTYRHRVIEIHRGRVIRDEEQGRYELHGSC